jgi:hypothetical protein
MNENNELQVIYNYLVNDVSRNELRELVIYLREFIKDGYLAEFDATIDDYYDLSMNIILSHRLTNRTSINNFINDLRAIDFFDLK